MKRLSIIISALMLVFGLTQCKKNNSIITPAEGVIITLDVDGGSRADVTPPKVAFISGDVIYVGSNGKYVGTLTHNGSQFSGSISGATAEQPLYFYFLGNKTPSDIMNGASSGVLTAGSTTSLSVNISDQSNVTVNNGAYSNLPVISMGVSNENYSSSTTTYTSRLYNKCSLMKFNVTTPSAAAVFITGMNNRVTVDFTAPSGDDNGFSYSADDNKLIKLFGGSGSPAEKWAIVLPQNALATGATGTVYTADGAYEGSRPAIAAISSNQYLNSGLAMNVNTPLDMNNTPVTFVAKTAGAKIEFVKVGTPENVSIQYSTDGSNWQNYTIGTTGTNVITLTNVGAKVMFRASNTNTTLASGASAYHRFHVTNGDFYAYGNVMSLLYNSFKDVTTFPSESTYTFFRLFYVNKDVSEPCHIYNHTNKFILPATTLVANCYQAMFFDCTQMTEAPELPATTLASNCYNSMFCWCENLETAPNLNATSLEASCYKGMFYGCSKLTTAPVLSVETLAYNCYEQMFMLCSALETAPALPANTLVSACYHQMFFGCSKLSSITCLATSGINTNSSTADWLGGVAESGTFTRNSSTPVGSGDTGQFWPTGSISGIPSGWSYTPNP